MSVRAKFRVEQKDSTPYGRVRLTAVYSTDPEHENKKFWDATPSGVVDMYISNPAAFEQFSVGDEVYVDFTLAPKGLDIKDCASCGQYHVNVVVHTDGNDKYFICSQTKNKVYIGGTIQ